MLIHHDSRNKHTQNKNQLIDAIRQHNPSADVYFLRQFKPQQLADYLRHIESAQRHEVRIARPCLSVA